MEYKTCTTCGLQNKKSKKFNQKLTNRKLAASKQHYQQKYEILMNKNETSQLLKSENFGEPKSGQPYKNNILCNFKR